IKEHKYDLIIPMLDEGADFLSQEKVHIEKLGIRVAIEDYEIFQKANDKQKLMELCREYDLPHPRTEALVKGNLDKAADYVGFPAMIKPNISAGAKGIVKVDNMQELKEKFPNIEGKFGQCTLQQYVEQPDYYYNVMLYRDHKGEYPAYTIIKIRRYFPLKGGSSCYSETVEHKELLQACKIMLEKLNWKGFADIDVLEDKRSGELKIIEINPRTPSSFQASFAAGVDFAEIFVEDNLNPNANLKKYPYYVGKQVRWFGLDAMWFVFSKNRFNFKPSWFMFWGKDVSYHDGT
ncbi:MAG: ATP-grasp domain-containing protein, partial [Bacteroidales bacterium]|nr:ATP-grasp domain-containing protein [Bacteroidales bacterium]